VMLTAQGAYLKLEGGNIMIHGPGTMTFKASMKELAGPPKGAPELPHLPSLAPVTLAPGEKVFSTRVDAAGLFEDAAAAAGAAYVIQRQDGTLQKGNLDQYGRTARLFTPESEKVTVLVGDGEWEILEDSEYD